MATVTPTVAQYFIPELWANRALEVLRNQVPFARVVMKDTEVDTFSVGDILNIPIPGTFTANDKAAGSAVTLQTPSDSTVAVTLNKHKEVSFLVEDVVKAQANQSVMDNYIKSAVVSIAEAIEKSLMAELVNISTEVGTLGTAVTASGIRAARKKLNTQKCPMDGRKLILSPDDETATLGDSTLASFFAQARVEAISQGILGNLYGFETFMSQLVPVGAKVDLGGATGGTFTITFGGQTTSAVAYNASAATLKTAIEALSTIGSGNVEVVAVTDGFELYCKGTLAGNVASFTASFASLTGATDPALTDTHHNPAFNREAFVLAMRALPNPDPNSGARAVTMKDPESGLVIRVLHSYNPSYLGQQVTLDVLYGTKTVRAAKATLLKS